MWPTLLVKCTRATHVINVERGHVTFSLPPPPHLNILNVFLMDITLNLCLNDRGYLIYFEDNIYPHPHTSAHPTPRYIIHMYSTYYMSQRIEIFQENTYIHLPLARENGSVGVKYHPHIVQQV